MKCSLPLLRFADQNVNLDSSVCWHSMVFKILRGHSRFYWITSSTFISRTLHSSWSQLNLKASTFCVYPLVMIVCQHIQYVAVRQTLPHWRTAELPHSLGKQGPGKCLKIRLRMALSLKHTLKEMYLNIGKLQQIQFSWPNWQKLSSIFAMLNVHIVQNIPL